MMKIMRSTTFIGILLCLAFAVAGCTIGTGAVLKPQSHFDFPNSNVIPLGKAHGKATSAPSLYPIVMDADLHEEAVQNALRQKGGDILIDYTYSYKITMFPLMFLSVYTTTVTVDGTACKMEIGEQELGAFEKFYEIEKVGDQYKIRRRK